MSCCGGNCGCGSDCKCGNGCGGCKMYPDLTENTASLTAAPITGVATNVPCAEGGSSQMAVAAENGGCNGGSDGQFESCNCK